jgi:hypothetical protein
VRSRSAADRLKTYWGIDQADRQALCEIVGREFDGALDLVIDDASHAYEPTRASFETLFPYLRPGGFYIIEDWAWSYREEPPSGLKDAEPLLRLVQEAVDALGRSTVPGSAHRGDQPVASITVLPGFAVIEKGRKRGARQPASTAETVSGRRRTAQAVALQKSSSTRVSHGGNIARVRSRRLHFSAQGSGGWLNPELRAIVRIGRGHNSARQIRGGPSGIPARARIDL